MTEFREFKVGDLFDICSSNGIFHAVNVNVLDNKELGSHPYIVRTSKNNGSRGYLIEDENKLNEGNTISFAQDTAQIFYQTEPYFTGNKIKIFKLKHHSLNESIALYLITSLNKAFSKFKWGSSYESGILNNIEVQLPVRSKYEIDWNTISSIGGAAI